MRKVVLVDYGAGNLASVVKGLRAAGADVSVATAAADLAAAQAIVVPGVGHFDATRALDEPWRSAVLAGIDAGAAVLGICLGMQWLFDGSEEAPALPGLGVFAGTCVRFREKTSGVFSAQVENPEENRPEQRRRVSIAVKKTPDVFSGVKVPHVGWNTIERTAAPSRILDGVPSGAYGYFTHSYVAPVTAAAAATTTHGMDFASVVARGRVFGAQWHPEKSGGAGLRLLRNFITIAAEGR